MSSPASEILIERVGTDVAVVRLLGEHDLSTAGEARARIEDLYEEERNVVVDMTDAEFIDSAIIHVLLDGRSELVARGRRLVVQVGTTAIVRRSLEIAGVLESIPTARDREQALTLAEAM
jgi:anti-anti-sigma factor